MSKNSTSTGILVLKAIKEYGLGIRKFAFTSGHPIAPYLNAFGVNLFMSANARDVGQALKANIPAGLVWTGGAGNAANGVELFPDEVFFLNGMGKGQVLEAFCADIFFDDQVKHVSQAAPYVSAAQVPMDGIAPANRLKT